MGVVFQDSITACANPSQESVSFCVQAFCPLPHAGDTEATFHLLSLICALACYHERIAPIRHTVQFSVCFENAAKALSKKVFARRLCECITQARWVGRDPPSVVLQCQ